MEEADLVLGDTVGKFVPMHSAILYDHLDVRGFVDSLVIQFEISLLLSGPFLLFLMNLAWKNGQHSTNVCI